MPKDIFVIRPMTIKEVEDIAIEWAAREGWNPGLHDAIAFHATDPEGFLLGEVDGKAIGCISAINYNTDFAFMGFYIVQPEHRGKGYGYKLWQAAVEHCDSRLTGLDGVVEQQENYKKSGFTLAYNNVRFEGKAISINNIHPKVQIITEEHFEEISEYDSACFPVKRDTFLKEWVNLPDSKAVVYIDRDSFMGYGVIRKCRSGYKIGPLFADDQVIAEQLFLSLNQFAAEGESIFLDIPDINLEAKALVSKYNMNKVFETARMYTGDAPNIDLEKVFGVTSFELG